jgi:hypothetical protein
MEEIAVASLHQPPQLERLQTMPYGTIVMENGQEVLFELEGPYRGPVSDEGIVRGLQERFDRVMALVQETAQSTRSTLASMAEDAKPSEYEIKFGLKLTADAGVVFAKAGTEGTFEVTLRWGAQK